MSQETVWKNIGWPQGLPGLLENFAFFPQIMEISGLSTDLALWLSGIIICTHINLLNAWVMSQCVGSWPMLIDIGRYAPVTISDFHRAMRTSGLSIDLALMILAIIVKAHMKLLNALVMSLCASYKRIFGRCWSPCVGRNFGFSWRHANPGLGHIFVPEPFSCHYWHSCEDAKRFGKGFGCKLFADFGRSLVAVRESEFKNFMAHAGCFNWCHGPGP